MVYDPGLYGNARTIMNNVLTSHHYIRNRVYLLNKSHQHIADMTHLMIDGTIDMDAEALTTRSLRLNMIDPARTLGIDFGNVSAGPQYYNYMIKVVHEFRSLDNDTWYGIPMFTGPVTDFKRDDVVCTVTGSGMEVFCQNGNVYPWTAGAGNGKVAIIRYLLSQHAGEILFDFVSQDNASTIMQTPWVLEPGDNVWEKLVALADSIGARLFYNANGVACLRPKNYGSVFTFDSRWLIDNPDIDFDQTRMRNVVVVEGGVPPGGTHNIKWEAFLPPTHPYSGNALGRNGIPMYLPEFIKDDTILTVNDAALTAINRLNDVALSSLNLQADAAINPVIEENDIITITHSSAWAEVRCTKWTIPLRGNVMSIGSHATTSRGSTYGATSRLLSSGLTPNRYLNHGPSGAFNTLGGRGGGKRGPKYSTSADFVEWTNKGRNKNKNKNKGNKNKGNKNRGR